MLRPLFLLALGIEEVEDHGLNGLGLLRMPHLLQLLSKIVNSRTTPMLVRWVLLLILLLLLLLLQKLLLELLLMNQLLPSRIHRVHRFSGLHSVTRATASLPERPRLVSLLLRTYLLGNEAR